MIHIEIFSTPFPLFRTALTLCLSLFLFFCFKYRNISSFPLVKCSISIICKFTIKCHCATVKINRREKKLLGPIKCLLVLPHGQADVECGVSINSEIMQFNFKETSVVALCTIYKHIQAHGGLLNVKIHQVFKNLLEIASIEAIKDLLKLIFKFF